MESFKRQFYDKFGNMVPDLKLGLDAEFFLADENGIPVSSIKLFGEEGFYQDERGKIERDGFPIEIQPAAGNFSELMENYRHLLGILKEILNKNKMGVFNHHFITVDLNRLKDDKKAMIFGCKPDRNNYKDDYNIKPDAVTTAARTAGAHPHVELTEYGYIPQEVKFGEYILYLPSEGKELIKRIIKNSDVLLGLSSVILDNPSQRRQVYGKAGDFRYTSYGFEYRTLSNYFGMSPKLFFFTYHAFLIAIQNAINKKDMSYCEDNDIDISFKIAKTINNCDKKNAISIFEKVYGFKLNHNQIMEKIEFGNIFKNWEV